MGEPGGEEIAKLGQGNFAGGEFAFFVGEDLREVEETDGGGVGVDLEKMAGGGLAAGGWSGRVALLG